MVIYAALDRRGWQFLPGFLSKLEAIINIHNDDERCFGYSDLYFLERTNLQERHCEKVNLYTNVIFLRHHYDTHLYPIAPNDIHLYEDQLQMNINVFFLLR